MDVYIDVDSKELVDINSTNYTEQDLLLYDTLFETYIGSKLIQLIEIHNKYQSIGSKKVINEGVDEYFEKLFVACCPTILKGRLELQQMYELHLTSILFKRFNDRKLNLQTDEFEETIYFPNLLNICAKYLINARRFIHRTIKSSFKDFKEKSNELVTLYLELYNIDEQYILNDVNYLFLGNVLPKYDPIKLPDVNSMYLNTIQQMFNFYLKSKISRKDYSKLDSVQMYDYEHVNTSSERYCLYEEALYLAELYRVCKNSNVSSQIDLQLNKFKNAIITHELQKLLVFNVQTDLYSHRISNVNLLQEFYTNAYDLTRFKTQTPLIYRLLRSIHVKNAKSSFAESDIVYIKPHIQSTLNTIFSKHLGEESVKSITPKLTDNLVTKILTGEYIDMMTMTVVNIPIVKFTDQLKLFLTIILDIGNDNGRSG